VRDVLILGGYGNFGKRIAEALVYHGTPIVIAGRRKERAGATALEILEKYPSATIESAEIDAEVELEAHLQKLSPKVVINTCGPFQRKDYRVAETCIQQRVNYIDLADGRDFVAGIGRLDRAAKAAGVSVITGASTVPGLSSAVLEHYKSEFAEIDGLTFGIAPGQKAERGLATVAGILTYVGRRLAPVPGDTRPRYGFGDLYRLKYPELGYRWMANCDVPDLDLLPQRYNIREIRFSAGMESWFLHFGIFAVSWLVRLGLAPDLAAHGSFLLRASHWFDVFGSDNGGMHVIMRGRTPNGQPHERRWFLIARNGDGPQVPCVPAILIANKMVRNESVVRGAYPCVAAVSLREYLRELERFSITTFEF
jgi:Saccharopine dehydrogenase NADP binding domain